MKTWTKVLVTVGVFVVLAMIATLIFGSSNTGKVVSANGDSMNSFVRCLNDQNVVLFGFSGNLQVEAQLRLFGDYAEKITTVDCHVQPEECKGVFIHPSWRIRDRIVSGGLSLGILSQLTGCKIE